MASTNIITIYPQNHEIGKNFITFLIISEILILIPIVLEEYLLAISCFSSLAALIFIFNKPSNGLIILPIFLFMPFEIPGLGGIQFSELGTLLIIISFIFIVLVSNTKLEFDTPAILPLMIILIASVLSVINAKYIFASVKNILKFIEAFILIFILTVNYVSHKKTLIKILVSILIAGLLASVIGIIRFLEGYDSRVYGLLGGGFGAYIGICTIIAINIVIFSKVKIYRTFALIVLSILIAALILSQTRAWLLATIVAFLFVIYNIGHKKYSIFFTLVFLSIAFIIFWSLSQNILGLSKPEIISSGAEKALQTGFGSEDIQGKYISILMRIFIWIHGFSIFLNNPILGFGIGNLRFKNFFTGELGSPSEPNVGYVDNHWLNVLYETGIFGFIGWICFAFIVYRACRELIKKSQDADWKLISLSLSGSMIIFLIGGMFWALTVVHEMTVFIPFLIGLIFASLRILKNEKIEQTHR